MRRAGAKASSATLQRPRPRSPTLIIRPQVAPFCSATLVHFYSALDTTNLTIP